ncbi:MAG: bifunctional phosphopantothenoylcysteine decarboxylase/phosphopantothenate--cysteine ligase CoaBC [Bacteroidetes bacterium]|jgi:phosphopantothenoylcysteine decarboxylase/phosphopantothenate--cysteine ligase|nr:bifunctional phosphopantothenoylcysteine decarboxylase/phosphopantothenate--cysteine ligase CoaBC [Bacteroidota bacterium]
MRGTKILLGVTGGIAAYKSAYLARELVRAGADVHVVMTEAAAEFVQPLTFSALTRHPVALEMWHRDQSTESEIGTRHIHLATWCDIMLIAPASANTIAKVAHGLSDNLLTVLALACRRPLVVAPTMDADMYLNDVTQQNLGVLRQRGVDIIPPAIGEHASGLMGPGRLPDVEVIIEFVRKLVDGRHEDLRKKRVLVTAGPTYEPIDPVRFIGNRSSGKMGFAIATAAAKRGADVTLVTGPVHLETPRTVDRIDVETAHEMHRAVLAAAKKQDVIIMAAAVSDYRPSKPSGQKMKKMSAEAALDLHLVTTPDILAEVGRVRRRGSVLVGFALETENALENGRAKLTKKQLDLIVVNAATKDNPVFGSDRNTVAFIDHAGHVDELPAMEKIEVAHRLLDRIVALRA